MCVYVYVCIWMYIYVCVCVCMLCTLLTTTTTTTSSSSLYITPPPKKKQMVDRVNYKDLEEQDRHKVDWAFQHEFSDDVTAAQEEPATQKEGAQQPVTQEPVTQKAAVTQEPVTQESVGEQPVNAGQQEKLHDDVDNIHAARRLISTDRELTDIPMSSATGPCSVPGDPDSCPDAPLSFPTSTDIITRHRKKHGSTIYLVNASIIFDGPRFKHRGLLLDTARHFLPVETLLVGSVCGGDCGVM